MTSELTKFTCGRKIIKVPCSFIKKKNTAEHMVACFTKREVRRLPVVVVGFSALE